MWTDLPCQNFHLLICCAILESEKQQIMEKHYGFNEILKVSVAYYLKARLFLFYSFFLHLKMSNNLFHNPEMNDTA